MFKRHLERCANRPLGLTFEEDSDEENFVFDMNELRKEILNFIFEGDDRILSITVDNATYNDAMISCLKRRLVPRGGLSCVNFPTSNVYFKGAWMVHRHLLEVEKGPYDYLKEMVKPMLENFDKYWSDYNLYLSCAAILDLSSPIIVSPSPPSTSAARNYFDDYDHFVGTSARSQVGKSQLEMYLDDDALDLNSKLDILEFWHQGSVRYPVVSKMARDLLTILVSTVASESAFSIGGKTVSASRSSLKQAVVWFNVVDDLSFDELRSITIVSGTFLCSVCLLSLLGCHGPLSNCQPSRAFLTAATAST
uniref:Transposase n=1 Tax=Chenopodium quinoa TaxID=63459 RepID=A0A803MB46_CHEQI